MIEFKDVSKQYADGTYAVHHLNLSIKEGELFVLMGPSGCGKTTTLKMINRLIENTGGEVRINGRPIHQYHIHELRWNIGYVLQQIALFPHMSIADNIAVVPELKKWEASRIQDRVDELLNMVGLEASRYRGRKPPELSGGQQQRIGVLRALAADPEIVLMDEPFSALDPISRERLQDEILELQQKLKKTIVFVTHDLQEGLKLGDRIGLMREGKIVQVGTPMELLHNPVNEFAREFVGEQSCDFTGNMKIDVEQLVSKLPDNLISPIEEAIPAESTLQMLLESLSIRDDIPIKRGNRIIGILSRQALIQGMVAQMNGRGEDRG